MIIDCHGHYTTAPRDLEIFRQRQIAALDDPSQAPSPAALKISDDQIRESLEKAQLKFQRERGTDLTIFSPRASAMAHHIGNAATSLEWSQVCNDLIHRVCTLYPENFVARLPAAAIAGSRAGQLHRRAGALRQRARLHWLQPQSRSVRRPLDFAAAHRSLVVPALRKDGASWMCPPWCTSAPPAIRTSTPPGAHYINADTTAFMQFLTSDLFRDFPTLKFVIPHGGGAVPYHWGRYRGLAQDLKRPPLSELLLNNVFFDTCVYHLPGIELLTKVIPVENILFASEMVGAVKGIDPETGHHFDDTKRYIDAVSWLSAEDKRNIFEGNALRVYSRLERRIPAAVNPPPRTSAQARQ